MNFGFLGTLSQGPHMSADAPTSYDEIPYDSYPYPQSHPDRLATVATLLGMRPAPVDRCRVLELGCASGGNLLPLALALPESTFVGVDLSGRQIGEGRRLLEALGLKNLELRHANILDITAEMGRFDYLICHGVYSWVPPLVQDKILEVCARNLSSNGVAYVSYNTYPGWHMRGMIRDIMCYHAKDFARPLLRVQHARNLLDFLARSVPSKDNPFGVLLKSEVEMIRHKPDPYLFHEHMEEVNDPVYFHQFAERALAKGLHFLGEVDMRTMVAGVYPPEVENVLHMLSPDVIHKEQYMDFLNHRMFRQTLLCLKDIGPELKLRVEQLPVFHVASPLRPQAASVDLRAGVAATFAGPEEAGVTAGEPIVKAALVELARDWPRTVPFNTLLQRARGHLSGVPRAPEVVARDLPELGKALITLFASSNSRLLELHLYPPRFVTEVSALPTASRLSQLQAASQKSVTNLRHESIVLDDFCRHLVRFLDGNRDRAALLAKLAEAASAGELMLEQDGQPLRDAAAIHGAIDQALDNCFRWLAGNAFLVA